MTKRTQPTGRRAAASRVPRPYRVVSRHNGAVKAVLPNGLTVVAREMHAAPVASLWMWYRVGSRNEHTGITGISHWLEHMLYKGTRDYTESDLDRLISREGGVRNGMTGVDFTTYFETMPSDKIDLALRIEADRMTHAIISPREVKSERTVIINERQGAENSPSYRLLEDVQAAAFKAHPYGHTVLGHLGDLQAMTREDLVAHYRRHYAPNNAIAAVAGDFDAAAMLDKLARAFGRLKPAPPAPPVRAVEPPQTGERRVTVKGEGATHYLTLAFHSVEAGHDDFFPLVALDSVLCGASGLSFFGGGTSNRSSRLSRALVDTGLAADIGAGMAPTIDPHLYAFFATLLPGREMDDLERALWAELDRVKRESVTQAELDTAIKQSRAQFAFGNESVTNQAGWLGFCEIFADYTWADRFLPRLSAVTVDDVQRVANRYLSADNATVGRYIGSQKSTVDSRPSAD